MNPNFLTVKEVAERLRLNHLSVYRMLHAGTIPHYRTGPTGRTFRIAVDDFNEYLNRQSVPAVKPARWLSRWLRRPLL